MVHWPTDKAPVIRRVLSLDKNRVNVTQISISVHTGTHIDAPSHFVKNGRTIDKIDLNKLIGRCYVCDIGERDNIDLNFLKDRRFPRGIKKIIFKTKNSNLWGDDNFHQNFVALTPTGARWIVRKKISLVGIDYLSIQGFSEKSNQTHKILLNKGVVIIEGLDLRGVKQGIYEIIALPIKIQGSDGAPARVILKTLS